MDQRARLLLLSTLVAACAPRSEPHVDRCLAGTIATADGCAPLPDRDPWKYDASMPSEPAKDASAPDVVVELDAGEPDAAEPDAGEPSLELAGTWALRVVNVQTVQSQLVEQQQVTFVSLSIVQVDPALRPATIPCALESSPFGSTTTVWPAAAIAATEVTEESVAAGEVAIGAPFSMVRSQVLGFRAVDPAEAIPEDPEDPDVYDADGDGNPGATLLVTGMYSGEIHVVSQSALALDGTITSSDRIEGASRVDQEQNVIGATNELFLLGDTTSEVVPELSSFEMIRVAEELDCASLIDAAGQLFDRP